MCCYSRGLFTSGSIILVINWYYRISNTLVQVSLNGCRYNGAQIFYNVPNVWYFFIIGKLKFEKLADSRNYFIILRAMLLITKQICFFSLYFLLPFFIFRFCNLGCIIINSGRNNSSAVRTTTSDMMVYWICTPFLWPMCTIA